MTNDAESESNFPALHDRELRLSYRVARGEQGVLSFEPYKSMLLPFWRFKTPDIAEKSSQDLWTKFLEFDEAGDFVGMDMSRKFIQMGMTRAKRYANYQGGKKYAKGEDGKRGEQLERGLEHKGKADKEESSRIFKEVWEKCRGHEGYLSKKAGFLAEQKQWDKERKNEGGGIVLDKFTGQIKGENDSGQYAHQGRKLRTRVKSEGHDA